MDGHAPELDDMQDSRPWRDQIVTWVLRLYCVLALPAGIWFEFLIIERERWLVAGGVLALLGVLVWSAFIPGLSHTYRARFLLWFLYLSGVLGLVAIGPHAAGNILLFAFVVVSAIVNGRKGAAYGTAISAATIVAIGFLHVAG